MLEEYLKTELQSDEKTLHGAEFGFNEKGPVGGHFGAERQQFDQGTKQWPPFALDVPHAAQPLQQHVQSFTFSYLHSSNIIKRTHQC